VLARAGTSTLDGGLVWIATTALRSRDDGDHAAPRVTMLHHLSAPVH
jgi:hypothetical protein